MNSDKTEISLAELQKLKRAQSKLEALEAGGVDNWEWYGESLKDWFKENEIDELVEDMIEVINDVLAEADVDQPAGAGCGYSITFDEWAMSKYLLTFAKDYHRVMTEE